MNPEYKILLGGCLRLLSMRPRSQKEIEVYLNSKTHDLGLKNQVITQLKSMKFLDDAKFASWLVESRSRSRPRGKRLLVQELKSKGVDTTNYELSTINELDLAVKALQKKSKSWSKLTTKDYRQKASRYLAARGFTWSTIETAVKKGYNSLHVS